MKIPIISAMLASFVATIVDTKKLLNGLLNSNVLGLPIPRIYIREIAVPMTSNGYIHNHLEKNGKPIYDKSCRQPFS